MDMDWVTLGFLDGLGTVGTWGLLGLALIFDKGLALKREVTQRDKTIDFLQQSNKEKDATILELTIGTRVAAKALDKVSEAAVSGGEGV